MFKVSNKKLLWGLFIFLGLITLGYSFNVVDAAGVEVKQDENKTYVCFNRKEYNLIERELRQYFDIRTMEVVAPLTLDLQIYCVGLMLKLGISEDKIREILKIMNKDGYSYDNPISMFVALQEKLEYYKDVEGVSEAIDTMIGVMTEITFGTDVDYEEWKSFMEDELAATLKLIPKTYDYELEKAKKTKQNLPRICEKGK